MGVWKQRDPETKEFRRLSGSGKAGANGGHYTPTVSDNGDGTVTFGWNPSLAGMPEVEEQTVELPVGPQGPQGETGATGPQGPQGERRDHRKLFGHGFVLS